MTKSVEQLERDWEIAKERDLLSPKEEAAQDVSGSGFWKMILKNRKKI